MTPIEIDTKATGLDWIKLLLAFAIAVSGFVFFYAAPTQPGWLRGIAVVLGLILGGAVMFTSTLGKSILSFGRDSYKEMRRVVWPTRKETTTMTLVVFGFVVIMSLSLWLTDKTLEWVFYDLILGWRK